MSTQNPKYLHEDQQIIRKLSSWTNSYLSPYSAWDSLHFQAPLDLFLPALPSITDWHPASSFLWPVGTAPCPLVTAPNEPFQAFLQSVPQAWLGLTVNKRNLFHYQFSNLSFHAPSAPVTMEHLMLSMFVVPSCRREHLADLWEWRDVGLENSRGWDCLSLFSVHHHLPKGHSPQEQFLIHHIQNEPDHQKQTELVMGIEPNLALLTWAAVLLCSGISNSSRGTTRSCEQEFLLQHSWTRRAHSSGLPGCSSSSGRSMDTECATLEESPWDKRRCTCFQTEELTAFSCHNSWLALCSGEQPKTTQVFLL